MLAGVLTWYVNLRFKIQVIKTAVGKDTNREDIGSAPMRKMQQLIILYSIQKPIKPTMMKNSALPANLFTGDRINIFGPSVF